MTLVANLLITGGAGFIGSHTCLVLLKDHHNLLVLDDFSNSSPESLRRVADLSGVVIGGERLKVIQADIRNERALGKVFTNSDIDGVIHFAGKKAVGESLENPLLYWGTNVTGSASLLSVMRAHQCRTIVFSSTSTVYGEPQKFPIQESDPTAPIHPYAQTKLAVEQILRSLEVSEANWKIACLRYFNPVGAHPSGKIGENPSGIPNNLFPYITQVAAGKRKELLIFGNDYPTPDGTGIRDYLHVMDLAEAHSLAITALIDGQSSLPTMNLGTGTGLSVLDVVNGFEAATGIRIRRRFVPRRPGDVPRLEGSPALAQRILGWTSKRNLSAMCTDGWGWQSKNPNGYGA